MADHQEQDPVNRHAPAREDAIPLDDFLRQIERKGRGETLMGGPPESGVLAGSSLPYVVIIQADPLKELARNLLERVDDFIMEAQRPPVMVGFTAPVVRGVEAAELTAQLRDAAHKSRKLARGAFEGDHESILRSHLAQTVHGDINELLQNVYQNSFDGRIKNTATEAVKESAISLQKTLAAVIRTLDSGSIESAGEFAENEE